MKHFDEVHNRPPGGVVGMQYPRTHPTHPPLAGRCKHRPATISWLVVDVISRHFRGKIKDFWSKRLTARRLTG